MSESLPDGPGCFDKCDCPGVATEPETPVPEATCELHLEKDGRLRVTAWVRPDQMYATLSAVSGALEPASDPTPELRSAINHLRRVRDLMPQAYTTVMLSMHELDAVLAVLGEPK